MTAPGSASAPQPDFRKVKSRKQPKSPARARRALLREAQQTVAVLTHLATERGDVLAGEGQRPLRQVEGDLAAGFGAKRHLRREVYDAFPELEGRPYRGSPSRGVA